jgi:ribosomal protein S18 acetylase RimI-like enzyme
MTESSLSAGTSLRLASDDDADFLLFLKSSTLPELGLLGLASDQLRSIIRLQVKAQELEYNRNYPKSTHLIVESNGVKTGRIWIDRNEERILVLDISILPQFRRSGIGTQLYKELMAEARLLHKKVLCSVSRSNEMSFSFHERLGFVIKNSTEMSYELQWPGAS